jgi:hypothetical protein
LTQKPNVTVQVKIGDTTQTFQGTPEETWLLLNKLYSQFIPAFETAKNLTLNVDIQAVAQDCECLIAFSPEGANVLASKSKMTDNETLALWLLASYMGNKLNLLGSDALTKEELQTRLGKSGKITSTRLGELVKADVVAKTEDDKFKITTFGVAQMQKEIIPRIKSKTLS